MTKPKPIWAYLGHHGYKPRLNLVDAVNRQHVVLMIASTKITRAYGWFDWRTIRPIALNSRHSISGDWQLRLDMLELSPPVIRNKPNTDRLDYTFTHFGDCSGLTHLQTPCSSRRLPDGSSRLVAKVVAHMATQLFMDGKYRFNGYGVARHAWWSTKPGCVDPIDLYKTFGKQEPRDNSATRYRQPTHQI